MLKIFSHLEKPLGTFLFFLFFYQYFFCISILSIRRSCMALPYIATRAIWIVKLFHLAAKTDLSRIAKTVFVATQMTCKFVHTSNKWRGMLFICALYYTLVVRVRRKGDGGLWISFSFLHSTSKHTTSIGATIYQRTWYISHCFFPTVFLFSFTHSLYLLSFHWIGKLFTLDLFPW